MVVLCDIQFDDNPEGIYFSGQVLTGRVTLQADKPKRVKGVTLKVSGYAHTSWSESKSVSTTDANGHSSSRTETTHYSGDEDYLSSLTHLLAAGGDIVVEAGIHTYSFSCHIPGTCPSSFEGFHGHIRYTVQVKLSRPWKFDEKYTKGFTVLQLIDLNYESPLLLMPSAMEDQKVFCCGPCKSNPLTLHVDLPQSGYVPGQNIPVKVLISNESRVPVEEIAVRLEMHVIFFCDISISTESQYVRVSKLSGPGVPRHCNKEFNYNLPVPATPSTCYNRCRLIQINYYVVVEAKVRGMHVNQRVAVPVTIGNVPLKGVIQQQPTSSGAGGLPYGVVQRGGPPLATLENGIQAAAAETPPPNPWQADSDIPPPNYEEAIHMKHAKLTESEEHDYGPKEFAPRYPVFAIPSPTAPPGPDAAAASFEKPKSTWL